MILGSAAIWLPATLISAPVPHEKLRQFFIKVQPPGFWQPFKDSAARVGIPWTGNLGLWLIATMALGATTASPLLWLLERPTAGAISSGIAVLAWAGMIQLMQNTKETPAPQNSQPSAI